MERRWLMRLMVAAGIVGFCPTRVAATQETVHPVADYLIRPPAPVEVIRLAQPSSASPPSPRSVVAAVGVLDGPESETFGKIVDVVTDDEGRIYVLDGHYRQVRVYDSELAHLQTVGAEGPGPGEFRSPRALALSTAGELFVFDYDGNVDIFAVAGGRLTFDRALKLPLAEAGLYQYVARLAASPEGALLVSIVHNTRTGRMEGLPYVAVQTLEVDPTAGTGESLGWRLPQIVAFVGDQPVTVVVAPFPRLIKMREAYPRGGRR